MQDVERRPQRPHNRGRVFMLAVIIAALLAGAFFLFRRPKAPAPYIPSSNARHVVLVSVEPGQITSFSARPTYAEPYTLVARAETFVPPDTPDFVMDPNRLDVIIGSLSHIEAMDDFGPLVLMDDETLEDFGLGTEAFVLEATYADGSSVRMHIGHRLHGELPLQYLMVEGSPNLYAISADIRDTFDRALNTLHHVPPINFTPSLLHRLTITGNQPLVLQHLEHDLWMMEEPFPYPADKQAMQQLLKSIGDMRLAAFVAPATEQNLLKYGFSQPKAAVRFELKPSTITSVDDAGEVAGVRHVEAQTVALTFGDDASEFGWYCLYDGAIYQASDLSMGFLLQKSWRGFASTAPVDVPLSAVMRLRAEANGITQSFDIALTERVLPNNELLRDDMGDLLYDFAISQNGREIEPALVTQPYARLMQLQAMGSLPEAYVPQGSPLLSLEIITPNYSRSVAFYRYDGLHAAMSVGGVFLHFVDMAALSAIVFTGS